MTQTKIQGKFYPLQKEELINLRAIKLINNAAYVHLALKYENPFCDRPVEIFPKQFALRWKIPESSVYKAIARLKDLKLLNIKSGKLIISWILKSDNPEDQEPKQDTEDIIKPKLSDPAKNSQIRQNIIRSENELSDPAKNSQIRENRELKPPSDIQSASPQTLQTYSDFKRSLSEDARENFFSYVKEQTKNLTKPINDIEAWLASKNAANQNRWEAYFNLYQAEELKRKTINEEPNTSTRKLTLEEKQRAIANFKNRHNRASQEDEAFKHRSNPENNQ